MYKPEEIVYIDEAGMDNRENYSYGGNERVQRFYDLKSGRRQGRINMIAGFCNGQLLAPFTIESSCNRTVFETWLETCLIPTLKPGQILIVDNVTFHKGGNIIQLIEAAGCPLKYLPSYSPYLNKIERCWSWLKSRIRKQRSSIRLSERCNGSCAKHSGLTALAVVAIFNRKWRKYRQICQKFTKKNVGKRLLIFWDGVRHYTGENMQNFLAKKIKD